MRHVCAFADEALAFAVFEGSHMGYAEGERWARCSRRMGNRHGRSLVR